jgi:hypothetical protein
MPIDSAPAIASASLPLTELAARASPVDPLTPTVPEFPAMIGALFGTARSFKVAAPIAPAGLPPLFKAMEALVAALADGKGAAAVTCAKAAEHDTAVRSDAKKETEGRGSFMAAFRGVVANKSCLAFSHHLCRIFSGAVKRLPPW